MTGRGAAHVIIVIVKRGKLVLSVKKTYTATFTTISNFQHETTRDLHNAVMKRQNMGNADAVVESIP